MFEKITEMLDYLTATILRYTATATEVAKEDTATEKDKMRSNFGV